MAVTGGGITPGWYADPMGRHQVRYWDGTCWTDQVANNGQQATDAVTSPAAAAPYVAPGTYPGAPFQYAQQRVPVDRSHVRSWPAYLLLAAAVATVGGSVLPWVTLGPISKNGLRSDGVITLPLGIVGIVFAILLLAKVAPRTVGIVSLSVYLIVAALAIADISDILSLGDRSGFRIGVDIGIGLWFVAIGAALGLAGGIAALIQPKRPPA